MFSPHPITTTALALVVAAVAMAQEPCSDEQLVFRAFPEANSYSRIVRDVRMEARRAIEQQLPFKVHFQELGEHALLVAFRAQKPVGLVYVRSEEAEWGLTEIAWYLTLDLRVIDFEFRRGRSPHLEALRNSQWRRDLIGRDFDGLTELVRRGDAALTGAPRGAERLARTLLRSATKAIVVTRTVWAEETAKLADQALGYEVFPAAARFTRRAGSIELDLDGEKRDVPVKSVVAYDAQRNVLGVLLWTDLTIEDRACRLRWVLDADLTILRVTPTDRDTARLRSACAALTGRSLTGQPTSGEQGSDLLTPYVRGLGAIANDLLYHRGLR
jgi:hypothetical protein